jgi:hypothetical protein
MKTTVEMPDALFTEVKKYASAHGLTMREVIETSLRRTLEQESGAKKRFRLRDGSFKGNGMYPGLDWPAIRKLIYVGRGG